MATRVNLMKLVQEIEGFSGMADRRPIQRAPQGLLVIEIKSSERGLPPRRKKIIPIRMLEETDIPHPVPIRQK